MWANLTEGQGDGCKPCLRMEVVPINQTLYGSGDQNLSIKTIKRRQQQNLHHKLEICILGVNLTY